MTPDSVMPSQAELYRRVVRLENQVDARIVTLDVYTAEKAAHTIEVAATNHRLVQLEENLQAITRLMIGAFLTIIAEGVFVALNFFGGAH